MGFDFVQNTAGGARSGFNPSRMFSGFNVGDGIKSTFAKWLGKEFKYTEIYNFLVTGTQQLANFDWNATDEEIKAKYKDLDNQLASAWGGVFGRGIGSAAAIALGGGAGLVVPKISGARLARQIVSATSKEAKEEIVDEAIGAIRFTKNLAVNVLVLEGFMKYRTLLKNSPEPLLRGLGFNSDTINFIKYQWGTKDGADMRISAVIEEKIESINNQVIQNFVEEAVDEFFESFMETGYIIAYELDEALSQYQLANSRVVDPDVIEIFPNQDNPYESFVIEADTNEEIEEQSEQIINNWRVMNNRDIGQIIAQDIEILETHPQSRRLEISFRSRPHPPWTNDQGVSKISTLTIPNFKAGITYDRLKRDLKYSLTKPAYIWGDDVAVLKFTDKRKIRIQYDRRRMTREEVETVLKSFADLSTGIQKTITANEIVDQPRAMRDEGIGMYPVYCKIFTQNLTQSNIARANQLPRASYEFPLWLEDEPEGFAEQINYVPPIQPIN
jgi:hypothetical protein